MWVLTFSTVTSCALLSLRSASFSFISSLRFKSNLKGMGCKWRVRRKTNDWGVPLPLGEFKAETIQHELMFVGEDGFSTRLLWCELHEVFERMHGDILVDRAAHPRLAISPGPQEQSVQTYAN